MKASELIEKLQERIEKDGDLEVAFLDSYGKHDLNVVGTMFMYDFSIYPKGSTVPGVWVPGLIGLLTTDKDLSNKNNFIIHKG